MLRYLLLTAVIGIQTLSGTVPVSAMEQGAAIKACGKNPQCGIMKGTGGVSLWIDHPGGGTTEIWCPDVGPCEVITRTSSKWRFGFGLKVPTTVHTPGSLSSSSDSSVSVQSAPVPSDDPAPDDSPGPVIIY